MLTSPKKWVKEDRFGVPFVKISDKEQMFRLKKENKQNNKIKKGQNARGPYLLDNSKVSKGLVTATLNTKLEFNPKIASDLTYRISKFAVSGCLKILKKK